MEIINKFGIQLIKLKQQHLETVRFWRNSEDVKQFMVYKQEITTEQQYRWFVSIDNDKNLYYLISDGQITYGMVNLKDINYEKLQAESGIFMFGKDNWNSVLSVKATYAILDYGFSNLNLKSVVCTVLANNKQAISFNRALGVKLTCSEDINVLNGVLDRNDFYLKMNKYIKFL